MSETYGTYGTLPSPIRHCHSVPSGHSHAISADCGNTVTSPFDSEDIENTHILFYKVPGFGEHNLGVFEDWNNREKRLTLKIDGHIFYGTTDLRVDIQLPINTNVYNSYKLVFMNGILAVELYEVINERPEFTRKLG